MAASPSNPGLNLPRWWEEAADSIAYDSCTYPPPIAFVCGPGNSGKSTFSRLLLNTLLKRYERVGYLDTDVGQPEFTTPGCLSLNIIDKPTPDLTMLCLKTPERCFFFGDVNSRRDTKAYLSNILSLYDYFRKEYHQATETNNPRKTMLPLVINTSGWVKGVGYNLLVEMLRYMSPTHVVQIRISAESKNLPTGKFWLDGDRNESVNLIEISAAKKNPHPSNRSVSIQKEARIIRDLRIVAYFRQCLPKELNISSYKELSRNLASIPPYLVPLSKVKVTDLHFQVLEGEILQRLNATLVGLAVSSSVPASSEHRTPWCVGLGFVRAVDISEDLLYIVTPVPPSVLENVDLILQGSIEVPACLLQQVAGSHMTTNMLQKVKPREMESQMIARAEKHFSGLSL